MHTRMNRNRVFALTAGIGCCVTLGWALSLFVSAGNNPLPPSESLPVATGPTTVETQQWSQGLSGPPSSTTIPSFPSAVLYSQFDAPKAVQLCQYEEQIAAGTAGDDGVWCAQNSIPWQVFAQGEYVGPHRLAHVPEYRIRVDDQLEFVYRLTREETAEPYEF